MADTWIKLRASLRDNPKVLRLAELLKVRDPDLVRAKCENLWMYADTHAVEVGSSGDVLIELATFATLDKVAGLRGLLSAMSDQAIDWARQDDRGVVLPRFRTHQPKLGKIRADAAKRARESRSRKATGDSAGADSSARVTRTVRVTDAQHHAHGARDNPVTSRTCHALTTQHSTTQHSTERKEPPPADTPAVQAAPAPRAAAEQQQQPETPSPRQHSATLAWDGCTAFEDARRVQDAWNRAKPPRWRPASVNDTRGLYAAVLSLADANSGEPDPVGLLIRRIDEYRGSREGREFPASLKKFLAGKHLESLEQWDHAAPDVERPRGFETAAERAEKRARQIEAGATA